MIISLGLTHNTGILVERKIRGSWGSFSCNYRFYNHKRYILIKLFFSSIVEYHVVAYTCVFLDKITIFEQMKNNNQYQNISPIRRLTVTTKSKLTMHRITVKMLHSSQCSPYYLSLLARMRTLILNKCSLLSFT